MVKSPITTQLKSAFYHHLNPNTTPLKTYIESIFPNGPLGIHCVHAS